MIKYAGLKTASKQGNVISNIDSNHTKVVKTNLLKIYYTNRLYLCDTKMKLSINSFHNSQFCKSLVRFRFIV